MKIALFMLLTTPAGAWAKNYIVGGQNVDPRDPIRASTVGVYAPSPDGRSGSLCSGTLIGKDMAVTAAHCIQPGRLPEMIFGPDLHSPMAEHRRVEGVAVHPNWQKRAGRGMDQGDIAVVKFAGGMPEGYKKISTLRSDKDIRSGQDVVLAGYGISDARRKTGAGVLRKTQVEILNNRPGKSEMILDQSHGRGACHGDSGGPAFIQRAGRILLAGVTNRGYPDRAPDDCGHQVVYTKVPAYRSWILGSEKKLESAPRAESPEVPGLLKHRTNRRSYKSASSRRIATAKGSRRRSHAKKSELHERHRRREPLQRHQRTARLSKRHMSKPRMKVTRHRTKTFTHLKKHVA
jgi:V8-like Glu-specific endopeptidase